MGGWRSAPGGGAAPLPWCCPSVPSPSFMSSLSSSPPNDFFLRHLFSRHAQLLYVDEALTLYVPLPWAPDADYNTTS